MSHHAGSLQADAWCSTSQTRTLQWHLVADSSLGPSYSRFTEADVVTFPLSQTSGLSARRRSRDLATWSWYAVWDSPRSEDSRVQLSQGRLSSMPSGLARYSVRSPETVTAPGW